MRISLVVLLGIICLSQPLWGDGLRVLTYNIHHGEGRDGAVDLDRIARVIQSQQPDVVCLQEVDRKMNRTGGLDMPAELSKRLSMQVAYGPNLEIDGGQYGNATLSRFTILNYDNLRLPNVPGGEQRGALMVRLDVEGRSVDVWNTHFDLTPKARMLQAASLLDQTAGTLCIVAGDLNETADKPALQSLIARMQDSGAIAGKPEEGSIGVGNKARRIDFVLLSQDLHAVSSVVVKSDEATVASDHFPVLAVVGLPARPSNAAERGVHDLADERIEEAVSEGE
ncbi:MAG: metal-dependent hydrolase [Candidatus Hydrogenedentota bacterium]